MSGTARALFDDVDWPFPSGLDEDARRAAALYRASDVPPESLDPSPGAYLMDVFERAKDPRDAAELVRLHLGRVEVEAGRQRGVDFHEQRADEWRNSRVRRTVSTREILASNTTVSFIKKLFDSYFRDDLYGRLRQDDITVLSSGSVDETEFGLARPLIETVRYALDRNWYGYSDSRGRESTRDALARYEASRMSGGTYSAQNVCVGLGGTALIASAADLILSASHATHPAICGIPNYPPLVQSIARRHPVELAPIFAAAGQGSLDRVIARLHVDTPLVLIQTALNPSGAAIPDTEIERLLDAAGPSTMVILDECHESLGRDAVRPMSARRADPRVVRVNSLSKNWSGPGLKAGWLVASPEFVSEFYEYSSTSYGGPASLFYTLLEVMARMERWLIEGATSVTIGHVAEFEQSYGLKVANLQRAFDTYATQRLERERGLRDRRDATVARLAARGARPIDPAYSINIALKLPGESRDYPAFRRILHRSGVSVFPATLCFVLSADYVRLTTSRPWRDVERGLEAVLDYLQPVDRKDTP